MSTRQSSAPQHDEVDRARSAGGPACSLGSRLRDEGVSATASRGERWMLVEVAGAWGWSAWTQSPALDPRIGQAIARRIQDAGMRSLAIRRPGRARHSGRARWRWAIVDTREPHPWIRWGEAPDAASLLTVPLDGSTGVVSEEPLYVVCAHGRHDTCCATRGRTVAAALAHAYPSRTWECSHLGGDRFAATMLLFPHGLNYGRADDIDPVATVRAYAADRIERAGFRGRVTYSRIEQAAQAAATSALGDERVKAYRPTSTTRVSEVAWEVTLETPHGDDVVVNLTEETDGPVFTTCGATVPVGILRYRTDSVRVEHGRRLAGRP